MIFLGAGSSIPFDTPGSKTIVDEVEKKLWRHSQRINDVRKKIRDFGLVHDIESVLSVLSFWADPTPVLHESGAFWAELVNKNIHSFKAKAGDAIIATRIKEYIVRRCFPL